MRQLNRRGFLKAVAATAGAVSTAPALAGESPVTRPDDGPKSNKESPMKLEPLSSPWSTPDPFLFCVHHLDAYPKGDDEMGPAASIASRSLGQDFSGRDGWSMYHGRKIPGFPRHPHRGFETVTVTRKGYVDHSDSLGATARYGAGDAQWMTAGRGIVHAEMFPLRERERANPLELFQIWINLPAESKFVEPHFAMFWQESIPSHRSVDDAGRATTVVATAGKVGDVAPPPPPPHSWAAHAESEVSIWTVEMQSGANWTLPPASPGLARALYFYRGDAIEIDGDRIAGGHRIDLDSSRPANIRAGAESCELLLLQGRPIGEPVAQYGPFVMNTEAQIRQAFEDYQRDGFGGWKWSSDAPVHAREQGRFAIHADGRRDEPA